MEVGYASVLRELVLGLALACVVRHLVGRWVAVRGRVLRIECCMSEELGLGLEIGYRIADLGRGWRERIEVGGKDLLSVISI